jgi:serine protease Do
MQMLAPGHRIRKRCQAAAQSQQDQAAKRGYLGVQLRAGAFVGNIEPDGPAQAAGIQAGDLIVRFEVRR